LVSLIPPSFPSDGENPPSLPVPPIPPSLPPPPPEPPFPPLSEAEPKPPPVEVMVEKTELFPLVAGLIVPPAPTVTVYAVPKVATNPVSVRNPPAPPPPIPPPPPPAMTRYSRVVSVGKDAAAKP
jgi:hypothetical protein